MAVFSSALLYRAFCFHLCWLKYSIVECFLSVSQRLIQATVLVLQHSAAVVMPSLSDTELLEARPVSGVPGISDTKPLVPS